MKSWLLLALFSALCLWAAVRGQGVRYVPVTAEEQAIADECESNLTSRDKYSVSLIRYTIGDDFPVSLVETDAPNTDPYLENCTTINLSSNSSSNDSIRSIVRLNLQNDCHDVLFLAGDGSPVVCGYNQIFAGGKLDYQPRTEEERVAETHCKRYLPHPHSTRPTLIEYEADPEGKFPGYFLRNTTHLPDDGNPFREDCATIFTPGDGGIRPVISIFQTGTCHDVLFFANGKNPVVCLYVNTFDIVHGGEGAVYRPTTAEELRYEDKCKEELPKLDRYDISLRRYTLREGQTSSLHKTDTADSDTFIEDCDSVGISDFSSGEYRDILFLVNGTSVTCHDVLFLFNNTDPVVCYYQARTARPIVDYEPRNPEEEEIDRRCKETLPRPPNTRVSLVRYESNPNGAFPGYTQWNVSYSNTQDEFRENCTILFNSLRGELDPSVNESVNETRSIILIGESSTCHDVLFYSGTDPVVCLYIIPHNVEFVVHKTSSIIVLVFTSLSVIASTVLLATHFIFPSLQTNPSRVIMNLATTFLLGDIFLIAQVSLTLDDPSNTETISAVVIVAYYFYYSRFVWMALAGFEMCRTIHVGTQLRFNSKTKRLKILLTYMITGWSLPLIPTIIMAVVHYEKLEEERQGRRLLFGIGGIVITVVPVALVIMFNIGIIVYLSYVLHKARQWQIKVTDAIKSQKRKTNFSRIFIIILSLLGVTWILLLLVYIDDIRRTDAVLIITSVFNSVQPIFVAISFVGTKKIFRKYKNLFMGKRDTEVTETSGIQNRFRNRRLLSFLFTDKELAEAVSKHPRRPRRFGRGNRTDSELSATSFSMLTRDSTHSLVSQPPASNGISTPLKDSASLAPISEEAEEPEEDVAQDPSHHISDDLKDSST